MRKLTRIYLDFVCFLMGVYTLAYDLRYVLIIFVAFIEHKSKANIGFFLSIFPLSSNIYSVLNTRFFLFH